MLVGFSKQYYENAPNVSVSMDGEKAKHCNVHLFCNLRTNTKSRRTNIWEIITCVLACCHYSSGVIIVLIVTNFINLIIKYSLRVFRIHHNLRGNGGEFAPCASFDDHLLVRRLHSNGARRSSTQRNDIVEPQFVKPHQMWNVISPNYDHTVFLL